MKFLLITHGNLAEGLLHSAKMLIGELLTLYHSKKLWEMKI